MTPEAVSSWQAPTRKTGGGQPRYSDLAIETALMPGLVFGLRLSQTDFWPQCSNFWASISLFPITRP
jgi:hypothetical protein